MENFLHGYSKDEVEAVIKSAKICSRRLSILEDIISRFNNEIGFRDKSDNLDLTLEDIQNEPAYKVFNYFYGIEYESDKTNSKAELLAPVLMVIEKLPSDSEPRLPWFESNVNRYLYVEPIEEDFLKLTDNVKDKKVNLTSDFFKRIRIDELHEAVIKKMQDQSFSLRATEIFSLYVSILIAKDLNLKVNSNDMGSNFSDDYEFETFKHVKSLFEKYYEKIKNDITAQKIIPTGIDPQDNLWNILLDEIRIMGERMKFIGKTYKNQIIKLKSFSVIDAICYDIKDFLDLHFDGVQEIPTMRVIEKKDKGPTLIKKIQAGDGGEIKGIEKIKEEYKNFLLNEQINLNIFKQNNNFNPSFDIKVRRYAEIFERSVYSLLKDEIDRANKISEKWDLIKPTKGPFDLILKDKSCDREIFILIKTRLVTFLNSYHLRGFEENKVNAEYLIISKFNPKKESDIKHVNLLKKYISKAVSKDVDIIAITKLSDFFMETINK